MKNQTTLAKSGLLILLITSFSMAQAQTKIDLQSALDSALKNNLLLKNEQLNAEYQRMLIKTSIEIPQANVVTEYGQINSFYYDNKLGLEQTISFPSIYNKQKSIQQELFKNSLFSIKLKEIELKKQVRESYFSLLYLYEKKIILEQTDSLYDEYLKKVLLQFKKGDVNLLEKTSVELQRGQITTQLNSLKNDIEINQLQFQLLINTRLFYQPIKSEFKTEETTDILNKKINSHPLYLILNQQKNISSLNTQLEKNKLLPNLNIGYYSMSMRGFGADNRLYSYSTRFNSVQFGVGVPLFFGSQKGKISAAKSLEKMADNSLNAGMQSLQNQIDIAYKTYQTALENVNYFETNALKNAETIIITAQQQFENGNINYLEWMMLINNATLVKSQYTDALTTLNKSMIQLYYLNSK